MEVIQITPRGYCHGVVRAIQIAKQCAKDYPDQPITILGMLVHNHYVTEALTQLHIHTIDDKTKSRMELLDEIKEGVVIFTAHGIAPAVIQKAEAKGLICVDATCPNVRKTQAMVASHLAQGYDVLYIGKANHPEAEAICALSERIHFLEPNDPLPLISNEKLFVTNQTTMSIFDIEIQLATIRKRYPKAIISEEICAATRMRQEAIVKSSQAKVDVLYVVGDRFSNNSNRLAQIAREHGIARVFLIDDVHGIEEHQLAHAQRVAVTAGASTPTYLSNQVIDYLMHYETNKEKPKTELNLLLE